MTSHRGFRPRWIHRPRHIASRCRLPSGAAPQKPGRSVLGRLTELSEKGTLLTGRIQRRRDAPLADRGLPAETSPSVTIPGGESA